MLEKLMDWIDIFLLSIVEGLTEFLPISSTGHLIIVASLRGLADDSFVQAFNIVIQAGAIAAVIFIYRERFRNFRWSFWSRIFFAFLPTAAIGFLGKDFFEPLLGSVTVVAITLALGGVLLLFIDRWFQHAKGEHIEQLTWQQCVLIGVLQSFALIPGVSRAAAAIIGALVAGLDRKRATEFSFFLAVPTLTTASAYKALSFEAAFTKEQMLALGVGTVLAFITAWLAIRFMIGAIERFGLRPFGWYRIGLGLILIVFFVDGPIL